MESFNGLPGTICGSVTEILLLLHDRRNPATLVRRGDRYYAAAINGLLHKAVAPSRRRLSAHAHRHTNPCHIEGACCARQIKPHGPAIREIERVPFSGFRCQVGLVALAVREQVHLRRDIPELDQALQNARRLDARLGEVVEPVARIRTVEPGAGRAAEDVSPEPLNAILRPPVPKA